QTIRRSVRRMQQIQAMAKNNNGVLSAHKQEAAALGRELEKLETNLTGIADMDKMPGALFVIDVCREANAVKEAKRLGIPIVAIVDPDPIDYVIPGNDDSVGGIQIIVDAIANVLKDADAEVSKAIADERAAHDAERLQKAAADKAERKSAAPARKPAAKKSAATPVEKPAVEKTPVTSARRAAAAAAQEAVAAAKAEATAEAAATEATVAPTAE
ncbi:MAG: 30S ribosomal protein S2, partial [Kiritimatiellia bacterium]